MANGWIIKPLPFSIFGVTGTAAGYDPVNMANDFAGVIWRSLPAGDSSIRMILDLGADLPVDTVALFGVWGQLTSADTYLRICLATAAQGAGFSGAPSTDGTGVGDYWDGVPPALLFGPGLRDRNGVLLWSRDPAATPSSVRYVFVEFGALNPTDYLEVSRLVIGRRIALERNFNGVTLGIKDLGSLDFSARAVLMRRRASKLRTLSLTFSNVHKDELVASVRPLIEYMGNTEMIAVVTDPTSDDDLQNRCYFGPHVGDLNAAWRKADCWEAKLNLVSIF